MGIQRAAEFVLQYKILHKSFKLCKFVKWNPERLHVLQTSIIIPIYVSHDVANTRKTIFPCRDYPNKLSAQIKIVITWGVSLG